MGLMGDRTEPAAEGERLGAGRGLLVWCLFFAMAFGLGYPTLNRYDTRKMGTDWDEYYRMVDHQGPAIDFPFSGRVLVPAIARPFYLLAQGRSGTWNPVMFGLLVSNCIFCASAAFFLLLIGLRVLGDMPLALLGCTLYLLNFVVSNLWLAGMVDSSEGCLMLALMWCLFAGRWWMLPLIGIAGGLAKQSFLPFSVVFATAWWLVAERPNKRYWKLGWVAALGCACAATMALMARAAAGHTQSLWAMAEWWNIRRGYWGSFLHVLREQQLWYAFVWLLPLGVWRLNRLPKAWVTASIAAGVCALGLGVFASMGGTVNRPLFNVMGPILSVSVALLLGDGAQLRRS
jgi:hypothetical protein